MQYSGVRKRSFLQSFRWVGVMLLAMGVVFLIVAVVMQFVAVNPENINVYHNGVRRPPTQETVRIFRLIFLSVFGSFSAALIIAGGIVFGRATARRRRADHLKESGRRVTADVTDCVHSAVHVNSRYLMRLRCSYTGSDGVTYIFKSGLLNTNPMPYLPQGQVTVYHDRDNIARYFVDVDGSVGLGTRVVEL